MISQGGAVEDIGAGLTDIFMKGRMILPHRVPLETGRPSLSKTLN